MSKWIEFSPTFFFYPISALVCNLISEVSNQCQHSFRFSFVLVFFVLIQQQSIKSKPQTQTNCLHFQIFFLTLSRESWKNCIRKEIFNNNKKKISIDFEWEESNERTKLMVYTVATATLRTTEHNIAWQLSSNKTTRVVQCSLSVPPPMINRNNLNWFSLFHLSKCWNILLHGRKWKLQKCLLLVSVSFLFIVSFALPMCGFRYELQSTLSMWGISGIF